MQEEKRDNTVLWHFDQRFWPKLCLSVLKEACGNRLETLYAMKSRASSVIPHSKNALCRYPSYILMITVYAVRRYPSQVGSLVWLRIAQPKMSRFGAILNNQPSGDKKSHHHHYHPDFSLSTWAPSKSSQVQFWNWCKSENRNCKKALSQLCLKWGW